MISAKVRGTIISPFSIQTKPKPQRYGREFVVNVSKTKSSSFKLLGVTGDLISDTNIIVNKFNNYFSTIGEQVAIRILPGKGSFRQSATLVKISWEPEMFMENFLTDLIQIRK